VKLFDNNFFGINNLEARYFDPQQRQLLEVVYECLENAGESLESVSGVNIRFSVANFTTDYVTMQAKDLELYHCFSMTGFGPSILANRISHIFNSKGLLRRYCMLIIIICASSGLLSI
jgi:acyl transferase domain-containing protein